MPHDDTIFLKSQVDVLSFFDVEQLRKVTPDIEHATYPAGEVIVIKGEVTSGLFIVKKGKVAVHLKPKTGPPGVVELKAGEFFGEVSMLSDAPAAGSVKSAEDGTEILTIPHASFRKLIDMQPLLVQTLLRKAADRKKSV